MVMIFREYAGNPSIDDDRVIRMLLLHDIVEIDAGDTFAYDDAGLADKRDREVRAAERIFALLPDDQRRQFRKLWDEFDQMSSPEGRFASVLDRLQPLFHNYYTRGKAWRENRVRYEQVASRLVPLREIAPELVALAEQMIREAAQRGDLIDS